MILSAAGYQGYPQQGYIQQQPVYIKQKSKKGFLGSNAGKMAAGRWYFQSLPHQFSLMLDVQRQRGVEIRCQLLIKNVIYLNPVDEERYSQYFHRNQLLYAAFMFKLS